MPHTSESMDIVDGIAALTLGHLDDRIDQAVARKFPRVLEPEFRESRDAFRMFGKRAVAAAMLPSLDEEDARALAALSSGGGTREQYAAFWNAIPGSDEKISSAIERFAADVADSGGSCKPEALTSAHVRNSAPAKKEPKRCALDLLLAGFGALVGWLVHFMVPDVSGKLRRMPARTQVEVSRVADLIRLSSCPAAFPPAMLPLATGVFEAVGMGIAAALLVIFSSLSGGAILGVAFGVCLGAIFSTKWSNHRGIRKGLELSDLDAVERETLHAVTEAWQCGALSVGTLTLVPMVLLVAWVVT